MKSRASLFALALVASPAVAQTGAAAPDEPQGAGPRGSSQPAAGERRFDAIGYAGIGAEGGVTVSATGLPAGGFVEVTAIETGKTIVAAAGAEPAAPGRMAMLSRAAAAALGVTRDPAGVRVRPIDPPGPEIAAIRAGQANVRADAPPVLLTALRRKLGPVPAVARAPAPTPPPRARPAVRASKPGKPLAQPAPAPVAAPAPAAPEALAPGFYVQYAALSSLDRATALAAKVGGVVERTDRIYRVHRGPYASDAEAKGERSRATAAGYSDAQIVHIIP